MLRFGRRRRVLPDPCHRRSGCLDDVGRGPLAGPVVAAAVIIPDGYDLKGINDSKKLTREHRTAIAERVRGGCVFAVAVVSHETVDELNILWASMLAMELACEGTLDHTSQRYCWMAIASPEGSRAEPKRS